MYNYKAKVKRVVDGDTIDVEIDLGFSVKSDQRLRLFGIDTPETRTRNNEEKARGMQAKGYVESKILDKHVIVRTHKTCKFGRYLAVIYYGENMNNINAELLEQGFAKEYNV